MSKQTPTIKLSVLFLGLALLVISCSKERQSTNRLPFKANTNTWYRIAPIEPSTVNVNGNNYFIFAYVPGGGEGNATHMGNVKTYFNQLAFTSVLPPPPTPPSPEGSLVAAVIDVITYPIFGAPLPLIQAGDFSGLSAINASLNIPEQLNGKIVNTFFYNAKGDAVFISNSTVSIITPVSPTRSDFSGKALIVGGRGKFANAVGEVDFKGWFNPNNPNQAGYGVDGWISY